MSLTDEEFDRLAGRSKVLHRNKHLLPVAACVWGLGAEVVTVPRVERGLGGRSPANRVLEALVRLCLIEAMRELPYPGQPSARMFECRRHPYWRLVGEYAGEVELEPNRLSPEGQSEYKRGDHGTVG